jgi:hypothetical protein
MEAQRLIVITGKRGRLTASAVVSLPPHPWQCPVDPQF